MFPKCIDLTSLYGSESEQDIKNLIDFAEENSNYIAAICVFPKWVKIAYNWQRRISNINIATVINFPEGKYNIDFRDEAYKTLLDGASEFDMPIDWKKYNKGYNYILSQVKKLYNQVTHNGIIKIILESGELKQESLEEACKSAIKGGSNFLKTSTGKTKNGANPDTVKIICNIIKEYYFSTGKIIGIKPSGGIKTLKECQEYINIVTKILGKKWLKSNFFRLGIGLNAAKNIIKELNA